MFKKIILGAGAISVFFILIFSTFFSQLYNLNYYEKKYEKYNVYDKFTEEEARNATLNIFWFFKSENELDPGFFNENEISHMQDVKILIQKTQQIYYISLSLFWVIWIVDYLANRKEFMNFFSELLFYSGILVFGAMTLFLLIYISTGFDFVFLRFHELFFAGNYSFNPDISNLKYLFPDMFFRDISIIISLKIYIKTLLLLVSGFFFMKKFK